MAFVLKWLFIMHGKNILSVLVQLFPFSIVVYGNKSDSLCVRVTTS